VAVLALWVGARDLVKITVDPMHHHHREDGLRTSGYLSANRSNQSILAILPQCQSLEDTGQGGAHRFQSRYVANTIKCQLYPRQKVSHLLANMLCGLDIGLQSSGL
jgi:hypothetical protein